MQLTGILTTFLAATSSVMASPTPNPVPGEPMLPLETRQISINPSEIRFLARLMGAERGEFSTRMNSFRNSLDNIIRQLPSGEGARKLREATSRLNSDVKSVLGDMDTVADVLNAVADSV